MGGMMWSDPKLKWNKDDYGGIDAIKVADHEIWQPDIYLYNSASGGDVVVRYGNPHAIVLSEGLVLWVYPSKFTALCEFDLFYWPFDTQHCHLNFASWTHSDSQIKLELIYGYQADLEPSTAPSPWLVDNVGEIVKDDDGLCNARFGLVLTRKSSSYIAVLITPIIAVVSLVLVQFCLSSEGGERIILSCCTALMVTMLLTHFTQLLPSMGSNTPWIVLFYGTSMYIVCFSLVESIFVLLLLKSDQKQPLPWIIKKHLQGKLGKVLLLEYSSVSEYHVGNERQQAEEMRDYQLPGVQQKPEENEVIIKATPKHLARQEWEILAIAIDRMSLYIYSFTYVVLGLIYVF